MRSGLVCSSQVLAAKTPIKIYPPQADYRHVTQSQKSPPAGMLMTYCKQCLEKQQKINELEEEITRLQGKLRRQERTAREGFFGSSTPSSKVPVKPNSLPAALGGLVAITAAAK